MASVGVATVFTSPAAFVKAAPTDTEAREDVSKIVSDMEVVMTKSYNNEAEKVKDLAKKGYDYSLSLESFYKEGLPYSNYDYIRFIAAYITIQNHCMKNGIDMKQGINEVNFVDAHYKDAILQEYKSEKIEKYKENKDGTFSKDGYTYITEPTDVTTYEPDGKGTYKASGKKHIDLEPVNTKYADITLSAITPEELYETFGLKREDFKAEEDARFKKLNEIMGKNNISQTVFIQTSSAATEEQLAEIETALERAETDQQKQIISIASSIIGMVPYEWGGKSTKAGFDDTWYTFRESGKQKGLDCSGYVQWVLRTANIDGWEELGSTASELTSTRLSQITKDELLPGDLGFLYPAGTEKINHVGIYLGNDMWIHCSSSAKTVTVSPMRFSIFRRFIDTDTISEEQHEAIEKAFSGVKNITAPGEKMEDPDMMLMAKIVQCEAENQGYNGWVAVAQVIKNRIRSDGFKGNNVREIVSAPGQFATYNKAMGMSDGEVNPNILTACEKVMAGEVRVIDDDVISFKRDIGDTVWNGWKLRTVLGAHAFYAV